MNVLLTQELSPLLTTNTVKTLSDSKVRTVFHVMSCNLTKLGSIERQTGLPFKTLVDIKSDLFNRFGAKKVNAFVLFRKSRFNSRFKTFKTGIDGLDQMLINGIPRGIVTQLDGTGLSAKTLFCYILMTSVAQEFDHRIIYLDTNLSFCGQIMVEILRHRFPSMSDESIGEVLSKIDVMNVFDMSSLMNTIETIAYDLDTNADSDHKDVVLVVLDSVSNLLSLELSKNKFNAEVDDNNNRPTRAMNRRLRSTSMTTQLAYMLRSLADKHSIAVMVTNDELPEMHSNWNNCVDLCLQFESIDVEDLGENEPILTKITTKKAYNKSSVGLTIDCLEISELTMASKDRESPPKSWPECHSESG